MWIYDEFGWEIDNILEGHFAYLTQIEWGDLELRDLKSMLLEPMLWGIYLMAMICGSLIGIVTYLLRRA